MNKDKCIWVRVFDGNFNISCPSGERANGDFKGKSLGAKWEFIYCPYCGKEIEEQKECNPCLDPDKMKGAGDQFGGSDY